MKISLDQEVMARHNRAAALMLIQRSPDGLARAELAEALRLTRPALSKIASQLLGSGIVRQHLLDGLRRSEPRSRLILNHDWTHAVVVSLTHSLSVGVVNLGGELVYEEHVAGDEETRGAYCSQFDQAVPAAVARAIARTPEKRILGIGVLSSGYVDQNGIIRNNGELPRRDQDMRQLLAPVTDLPVSTDEEMRLLLQSCIWRRTNASWRFAVGLNPGIYGYGGSETLVIDGKIFGGRNGLAGQYIWSLAVPHGEREVQVMRQTVAQWGLTGYLDRLQAKDPAALRIYRMVIENIGARAAHVASTYNPDAILLYSPYVKLGDDFTFRVREALAPLADPAVVDGLQLVCVGERSDRERLAAASTSVFSRIFMKGILLPAPHTDAGGDQEPRHTRSKRSESVAEAGVS